MVVIAFAYDSHGRVVDTVPCELLDCNALFAIHVSPRFSSLVGSHQTRLIPFYVESISVCMQFLPPMDADSGLTRLYH